MKPGSEWHFFYFLVYQEGKSIVNRIVCVEIGYFSLKVYFSSEIFRGLYLNHLLKGQIMPLSIQEEIYKKIPICSVLPVG